jgi:uncharacterized membrane protein
MSDSVNDSAAANRAEQPLYAPVSAANQTAPPPPPIVDGPSPGYTAPYPPYPYDPPAPAGLSDNVAAGLAYFTVLPAVLFLLLEPYRRNAFIRFHSWQSIFLFIGIALVRAVENLLVAMLPSAIAFFIGGILSLVFFAVWLVPMLKAFQGGKYVLPVVGPLAEKTAASSSVR